MNIQKYRQDLRKKMRSRAVDNPLAKPPMEYLTSYATTMFDSQTYAKAFADFLAAKTEMTQEALLAITEVTQAGDYSIGYDVDEDSEDDEVIPRISSRILGHTLVLPDGSLQTVGQLLNTAIAARPILVDESGEPVQDEDFDPMDAQVADGITLEAVIDHNAESIVNNDIAVTVVRSLSTSVDLIPTVSEADILAQVNALHGGTVQSLQSMQPVVDIGKDLSLPIKDKLAAIAGVYATLAGEISVDQETKKLTFVHPETVACTGVSPLEAAFGAIFSKEMGEGVLAAIKYVIDILKGIWNEILKPLFEGLLKAVKAFFANEAYTVNSHAHDKTWGYPLRHYMNPNAIEDMQLAIDAYRLTNYAHKDQFWFDFLNWIPKDEAICFPTETADIYVHRLIDVPQPPDNFCIPFSDWGYFSTLNKGVFQADQVYLQEGDNFMLAKESINNIRLNKGERRSLGRYFRFGTEAKLLADWWNSSLSKPEEDFFQIDLGRVIMKCSDEKLWGRGQSERLMVSLFAANKNPWLEGAEIKHLGAITWTWLPWDVRAAFNGETDKPDYYRVMFNATFDQIVLMRNGQKVVTTPVTQNDFVIKHASAEHMGDLIDQGFTFFGCEFFRCSLQNDHMCYPAIIDDLSFDFTDTEVYPDGKFTRANSLGYGSNPSQVWDSSWHDSTRFNPSKENILETYVYFKPKHVTTAQTGQFKDDVLRIEQFNTLPLHLADWVLHGKAAGDYTSTFKINVEDSLQEVDVKHIRCGKESDHGLRGSPSLLTSAMVDPSTCQHYPVNAIQAAMLQLPDGEHATSMTFASHVCPSTRRKVTTYNIETAEEKANYVNSGRERIHDTGRLNIFTDVLNPWLVGCNYQDIDASSKYQITSGIASAMAHFLASGQAHGLAFAAFTQAVAPQYHDGSILAPTCFGSAHDGNVAKLLPNIHNEDMEELYRIGYNQAVGVYQEGDYLGYDFAPFGGKESLSKEFFESLSQYVMKWNIGEPPEDTDLYNMTNSDAKTYFNVAVDYDNPERMITDIAKDTIAYGIIEGHIASMLYRAFLTSSVGLRHLAPSMLGQAESLFIPYKRSTGPTDYAYTLCDDSVNKAKGLAVMALIAMALIGAAIAIGKKTRKVRLKKKQAKLKLRESKLKAEANATLMSDDQVNTSKKRMSEIKAKLKDKNLSDEERDALTSEREILSTTLKADKANWNKFAKADLKLSKKTTRLNNKLARLGIGSTTFAPDATQSYLASFMESNASAQADPEISDETAEFENLETTMTHISKRLG